MTVVTEDVLQRFCEQDPEHYMSRPFVLNGRKYATDGRALVSIPCDEPDTQTIAARLNKIRQVLHLDTSCETQWPYPDLSCNKCGGAGSSESTKCRDCGGTGKYPECFMGEVTCEYCGHDHECDDCDGNGKCPECDGKKVVESYKSACAECCDLWIPFGESRLSYDLARKIGTLQDVKYSIIDSSQLVFSSAGDIRGTAMFLATDR